MDTKSYINEDFETLLVQKSFDQLLPEEKSFVLLHLESSKEYDQLRQLYLQVIDLGQEDEDLTPDPRVKKSLDALFEVQKPTVIPFHKRRIFWSSISGIAAIFIVTFLWFNKENKLEPTLLADNKAIVTTPNSSNGQNTDKIEKSKTPNVQLVNPVVVQKEENTDVMEVSASEEVSLAPPQEVAEKMMAPTETDNDVVANASAPARPESTSLDGVATIMEVEARYRAGNDQLIKDLHDIASQSLGKTTPEGKTKTKEVALSKKEADLKDNTSENLKSGKYFFHLSIDEKGNLKSVNILRTPNPGSTFDQELLSRLKKQLGKFEAMDRNGKKVSSSINLPLEISFQ